MTCKSTIGSMIGLGPSIAAPNQSIHVMDSQTTYLTIIAKKITNKAPKYHKEKVKLDGDGTYLCEMKRMQKKKNKTKGAQRKLEAAANGGSCELLWRL